MALNWAIVIVLVLNLTAFGLAIAAEQRRSKATVVTDPERKYTYCSYDSDIATGYGVGAFLLLLGSHVLVMAITRCFCCGSPLRPGGSRACAFTLFLLLWLSFFIAEVCLLAGSARNGYHTRGVFGGEDLACLTLRKGVFDAAASFIVIFANLAPWYFITFRKAIEGYGDGQEHGVGMSTYR